MYRDALKRVHTGCQLHHAAWETGQFVHVGVWNFGMVLGMIAQKLERRKISVVDE